MSWGRPHRGRPKLPRDLSCRKFHPGPRQRVSLVLKVTGPSPHTRCLQSKLPPNATSSTPILPPHGPGWGRGTRSCGGRVTARTVGGKLEGARERRARHSSRWPRARPGVGTGGTVSPRRAPAHAASPGAFTPVRRIRAAGFPQSSRYVATGSLSLQADQSPRGVQDSRRSTCTYTLSFLLFF